MMTEAGTAALRRWLFALLFAMAARGTAAQGLSELYRQAVENNSGLRAQRLEIERAQAQVGQARSRLLPQLSASLTRNWNEYRDDLAAPLRYYGARGSLQARQALFDLAAYLRLQGAHALVQQAEQERDAARMALAMEMVDRYLAALHAADALQQVQAEQEANAAQVQRLRAMLERRLAQRTDLLEVEAYALSLHSRELELRNTRAAALEHLRASAGMEVQLPVGLPPLTLPPLAETEEQWVSSAERHNPSLAALRHAIDGARELLRGVRAEHLPQISLSASRTHADQGFDNRTTPPYRIDTVGVQVTIPLSEGGRVLASARQANARLDIARAQYEQARREIERDTRIAHREAAALRLRIDSAAAEQRALEQVLEGQRARLERGAATVVEVLDAQRRVFRARADEAKARYDYLRALTLLHLHAGTLTPLHLEQLDGWLATRRANS